MVYEAETVGRSVENLAEKMADLTNTVNETVKDDELNYAWYTWYCRKRLWNSWRVCWQ